MALSRQNAEGKTQGKELKTGWDDTERMKRGRGMEDRDERSRGIEIHIPDVFAIIKPTTSFKLASHKARRKRNWSDSSGNSFARVMSHGECVETRNE